MLFKYRIFHLSPVFVDSVFPLETCVYVTLLLLLKKSIVSMLTYGLKFSKAGVISNNASSYQAFYIKKVTNNYIN